MDMEIINVLVAWFAIVMGIFLYLVIVGFLKNLWMKKKFSTANLTSESSIMYDDFDILYEELEEIYKQKLGRKKKIELFVIILFLIIIIFSIPLMGYVDKYTQMDIGVYSKIMAVLIIIGIVLIFVMENKFLLLYKKEIIERIAKAVNPSFEYRIKDDKVLKEQYKDIGFKDKQYTRLYIDDYIVGKLDESTVFSLDDLTLEQVVRYGDKTMYVPVFKGLVASMNYNNNIRNNIVIEDDMVVDSGTELSQNLLNRLIEVYKEYQIVPEIRMKPNYVFLRIHKGEFFEPGVNPMDKQKLFNYYNVIKFINEVMLEIKNATEI